MDSYLNLRSDKKPMKLLDRPSGFASSLLKRSLAHQMRFSVLLLEEELAGAGEARVLQIQIDEERGEWRLYANGTHVAGGSCSFARQCFEEDERAFLETCEKAVALSSERLEEGEFRLLSMARKIASIEAGRA